MDLGGEKVLTSRHDPIMLPRTNYGGTRSPDARLLGRFDLYEWGSHPLPFLVAVYLKHKQSNKVCDSGLASGF